MSNATQRGSTHLEKNTGVTENSFGKSVESQAQILDAEKIATGTDVDELLNVYRLEPISHDPKARSLDTIFVTARTAGDARIVAAGTETDFQDVDGAPAEDVSTANASVFRDPNIYTVIEVKTGIGGLQRGLLREGFHGD